MPRPIVRLTTASALSLFAATAHAAEKSQYNCSNGNLVRRVIIDVGDLSTELPCEVVYWKDTEAPGVRRVLWNARSDANFCDAKAAGLVETLTSSGWRCEQSGETPAAFPSIPAQPATPEADAKESTEVPSIDAATVATTTPSQEASPQTPSTAQTAAVAPAAPTPPPATDNLQTVIAQNLDSLNQSVDGDFKAQIGQFGDLNQDGLDDAIVFFNYESSSDDFTQFVAAYLFNGESYHLAATKPVGGTDRAVREVEIENIVEGSIVLKLHLNDASQTENRRAAMVLRDGQLVETE